VTACSVFRRADFTITIPLAINATMSSQSDSTTVGSFKEHVVVSFVGGQPYTDVTPLGPRHGLRDGFFTTMEQVLLGTRRGV
jgi:hypothetical protein